VVSRRYRNRRIGDFLKELELTEGRGTGIPKIRRAMQSNGSPPAEFKTDDDRTFFTVVLLAHPEVKNQITPHVTPHVAPHVIRDLSEVEKTLLEFCLTPRDRGSIQSHLKIKNAKHLRERYLKPLLSLGLLEMTDPEHPKAPTQKYRTTVLGRAELEE
jgi:ATP-dependent DNA helicase RecG